MTAVPFDTYVCDCCGLRFVLELRPWTRCLADHAGACCHAGDRLVAADGRLYQAAAGPQCRLVTELEQ